ncbi:MAG: diadenosine tetraphosphatase, partial [Gammaproteobacteria bacterium]|nr:diadenosine tetraphosphatase [Gammaproteobacteria bacterium]
MDFTHKAEQPPKGFYPWFKLADLAKHTRIVFGHWAALKGQSNIENIFAIDTGCVWGGSLTALRLEDLLRFKMDAKTR